MKKTPFNEIHKKIGAKMVEFAGFEMPIQYTSIVTEHKRVRETVGVFDVSHMGEFYVSGRDAVNFLQENTTNDVSKLASGGAQYTALVNERGLLLDDLILYKLFEDNRFMIVANASNIEKDFNAFSARVKGDIKLENASDRTALLSVQGPMSREILQKLTDVDLGRIPYYHFVKGKISGIDAIIARTGYTGELGFEIFFEPRNDNQMKMWNSIFDAGKKFGIAPIGLGARDTLRLEMGYCLYGNDIDETTNPIEAGLGWITKLDKVSFVGKEAILRAKQDLRRRLAGFKMEGIAIPRHGYHVFSDGNSIGSVTSGTFSPSLEKGIGMGYLDVSHAVENSVVTIDIRGKGAEAQVVKIPFIPSHARA